MTTAAALREKNRELYDDTFGVIWRRAIFDGLHGGHEFINLGGTPVVRLIGRRARLGPDKRVLELCSGPGAVAAYLARRYGCAVTGIDVNARQIAHARLVAKGLDREVASRLTFIHADACRWRPPSTYDVVLSIDAFMLLPDVAGALEAVARSLAPGGFAAIVTIAAGPHIDAVTRDFAGRIDGMVNLMSARRYARLARAAGLRGVIVENLTPAAVRASRRMLWWLRRCKKEIVAAEGLTSYAGWIRVSEAYLDAFVNGRLRYLALSARARRSPLAELQAGRRPHPTPRL